MADVERRKDRFYNIDMGKGKSKRKTISALATVLSPRLSRFQKSCYFSNALNNV